MSLDIDPSALTRRQLLAALAGSAGVAAGGYHVLDSDPPPAETTEADTEKSRRLAETYAPVLYFGQREKWFPTDPRAYASDQDGQRVVDGFDALDGYTADFRESGSPPSPTVFYHAIEYPDSSLACVQFWFYSAFDQFTTNFHWHDWEVLHVFVDTDADAQGGEKPVLFVASAHSRKVPNNEYLDPEADRAAVVSEVGSHSSALGVNATPAKFQRTATDDLTADISNKPIEILSGQSSLPLAYGLPRDEGLSLPFAVPELDGVRLPDHERLPNVGPEDLLPPELTVDSFAELSSPPETLPKRESNVSFAPAARPEADGDVEYTLTDIADVQHIAAFTGPQLSFTFAVPTAAEDLIASHLTTPGVPWDQPRFNNPETDITDPRHRNELADRYAPITNDGEASRLVGVVKQVTDSADAPGSNGVGLFTPGIEAVVLLESDPEAVPTFSGVITVQDPPPGDHRLTVNGAGMAPYSEKLTVGESGDHRVGAEGRVAMPANEDAVKITGESGSGPLDSLALDDDFGGRLYDGRPPGEEGTFGIYAHRDGAYTAEVTDSDGKVGAVRLNPDSDDAELAVVGLETGKEALADYLVRFLVETRSQSAVFEDGDSDGIDDVPTGLDVTDEVVNEVAAAAKENAKTVLDGVGDATDDVGDAIGDVVGDDADQDEREEEEVDVTTTLLGDGTTPTATQRSTAETSTPSDSPTPTATATATDTDRPGPGFTPGSGVGGLLVAVDASVLAALAAREQARAGLGTKADNRLRSLEARLLAMKTVVEKGGLPESLANMVTNRVDVMLPRVQAALGQD